MKETPMMKQYVTIKRQYPDKIVLFRMGDFYETFGDDAKLTAKVLNITLTSRDRDKDPTPLAGFPHHALEQYLPKIIESGNSAVIVDQLEDPKQAKGIVKRGVTRVVTPGTLDGDLADSRKNNYLLAVFVKKGLMGVSLADLATGEFLSTSLPFSNSNYEKIIAAYSPVELLIMENQKDINASNMAIQFCDPKVVNEKSINTIVKDFYGVNSVQSFGLEGKDQVLTSVAMIISYITETQKMKPEHISIPQLFSFDGRMSLDLSTIRNLDLVANSYTGRENDTLISVLDKTCTKGGRRQLYQWVLNPLTISDEINSRLDVVGEIFNNFEVMVELRELLSNVSDIDRIVGKIGLKRANAKDLNALAQSIDLTNKILNKTKELQKLSDYLKLADFFLLDDRLSLSSLGRIIEESIDSSPPSHISDGGIIKRGYDSKVDELREISLNSKEWLSKFTEREREASGITSLKVSFNKVFGYYIEVTKAHSSKVPVHYIRKQTLVNNERYITEELKKQEELILGAHDKLATLEYQIFQGILDSVHPYLDRLKSVSIKISHLDILTGFAFIAHNNRYIRPEIFESSDEGNILEISNGRHPVVELISEDQFVSNDTVLNDKNGNVAVITGPNMAGKSTYIRQVALIVLMAQVGSFVPADSARISVVDRIFSRVGAADNLAHGRSTFMVEMEETANIINNATQKSLVILDEVGRGTSTYDGVSIAWALSEHIVEEIKCRTLFATHYHELLELTNQFPEVVKNYSVSVQESEDGESVLFLRKIIEGGTNRSYGVYVAQLAGLPQSIITRANSILQQFRTERGEVLNSTYSSKDIKKAEKLLQIDMFEGDRNKVLEELKEIDIDSMTPIDALNKLSEIKKKVV